MKGKTQQPVQKVPEPLAPQGDPLDSIQLPAVAGVGAESEPAPAQAEGHVSAEEALKAQMDQSEPTLQQEVLALTLHHGRTLFRAGEMKQFFGRSKDLFRECRDAGWLMPVVRGNRISEYDLLDIVRCLRRLRQQGRPLVTRQNNPKQR